jgi:anionic cell wall polymer biosynthesis LytR-Cps2A-Psr (LCP) family protein
MHLDGSCALTYARERKVYGLGDLHRIQNQQDILSAMINKLTSSKTLLTNYTNILASLSDSIETNIPSDQFYRLINLQLDAMPSWNLERNTVNGTEIHVPTYTIPDQILFVFQQDAESIEAASLMIHEAMDAN